MLVQLRLGAPPPSYPTNPRPPTHHHQNATDPATAWRTPGACEVKDDCPTYMDCFNPETELLAEGSPLEAGTGGVCECYWLPGKEGDDCTERKGWATLMMIVFLCSSLLGFLCSGQCFSILIRLKMLGALDLSKPGNKTLLLVGPTAFFLGIYMFILLMNNLNMDESGFLTDKLRLLVVALMIVTLQLSNLQIATTWITIAGSAGKKNAK